MQRHRNPGNGFRSNPIGISGGGGGYNRSYNRGGGFGRGQPPPPRRVDVFMEAGKLAAEYLASKGLVMVNGKWQQNTSYKNPIGVGGGGGDGSDAVSGSGSGGGGRRRFVDDYSSVTSSRDGVRGRRTLVGFKSPAVEANREVNQSSEKVKGMEDKQGEGDSFSGCMEEQKVVKDGGGSEDRKSVSGDLETKSYDGGNLEVGIMNQLGISPDGNADVKTPVSEERIEGLNLKSVDTSTDDVAMDDGDQENEKAIVKDEQPEEESEGEDRKVTDDNVNSSDLLALIRFNKIPTRTRSSMTLKGSKSDPVLISGDENRNKQDDENQGLNHEPESEQEMKIEQVKSEDDPMYEFGKGLRTRSLSLPQRSSISDQQLSEGQHGYARSSSALLNSGEKRPLEISDITEVAKKPRDDYFHISSSRDGSSSQEGGGTPGITQQCNSFAEERQFFPSSSNIRDLNSMEVSDVHDIKPVIDFSSVGQAKQEPMSVDFDLTMNSSCDLTDRHSKGVEVIDLDCDSMQEDDDNENDNNNSERRDEAIFTDLESFPDRRQRVSDIPQDGYGLMISELLDADIPSSSVSTGVNSIHNEMSLPNEEELLGDDESIYMSLGEIPISFVPVWDQQPSQRYDKRY